MKLTDKGPIVPAPVLKSWAQKASLDIQSWLGMVSATHWQFGNPTIVDGADFYVGEHELGHIHLDGEIHVVLPPALHQAVVACSFAQRFRWDASFVQFPIRTEASVQQALWIFRLGHDRISGANQADLLVKIKSQALSTSGRAR